MKVYTDTYDYVPEEARLCQYGKTDFSDGCPETARYVPNSIYPGNPFIEALPPPKDLNGCRQAYSKGIRGYRFADVDSMTDDERIHALQTLRSLRIPMPFDAALESEMYSALERSYSARYTLVAENAVPGIHFEGITPLGKAMTDRYSSIAGFCLLGASGTGKSSAVDIMKSHYPQVIIHSQTKGRMIQIPYLYVVCPPNSNFRVLYTQIGAGIDKALGITNGTYENMVASKQDKFTAVKQLIEMFAVGVIIFDEIQELSFSGMKSNSYANLVTLSELTGVAIAVAGLESAYDKLFQYFYTGRRVGRIINSNSIINDKKSFVSSVMNLFAYQWFDEYVAPTQELTDALYEYTSGSIDALITMYTYLHIEYLTSPRGNRVAVDAHLLETVVDKYYGKLREHLKNAKDYRDKHGDFDRIFKEIQKHAKEEAVDQTAEDPADKVEAMKEILNNTAPGISSVEFDTVKTGVLRSLDAMFPGTDTRQAEGILKKLWKSKKNHTLSTMELTGKVIEALHAEGKKPSVRKHENAPDVSKMRQELAKFESA